MDSEVAGELGMEGCREQVLLPNRDNPTGGRSGADTPQHPHVGADQDASASAATEWPHGGGDVGTSSPPESGGDWGAGAARTAPSLGIEDLLPEEPEKKRQDGETGPESQPPVRNGDSGA